MSVINSIPLIAAGDDGYQISRSVRLRSSASAYFNRTPASAGNRQVMTFSWWMKRGDLSTTPRIFSASNQTTEDFTIDFSGSGSLEIYGYVSTVVQLQLVTTAVYRDPSAWYHVVVVIDSTQATNTNRAKLYVNGVQVTTFSTSTYPAQNTNFYWNTASDSRIGIYQNGTSSKFDGYLTEINFIDGQALTPSSFGQTNTVTGVWQPAKYTGTYGTNGFYLNFSDNSSNTATTIGKDNSGNGNNWTPNNISVTAGATYDSMIDVPTPYADGGNGRGNYATLNPIGSNSSYTLTNANLEMSGSAADTNAHYLRGTIGVSSGKWYWEVTPSNVGSGPNLSIGIQNANYSSTTGTVNTFQSGYGYYAGGQKEDTSGQTSYGASYAATNVIGVAFDADAGTITFYKDNTSQGVAFSSIPAGTYIPAINFGTAGASRTVAATCNFGQRPFSFSPPSGFVSLNAFNLP